MKKQILILCLVIVAITAYSQDTVKVKKQSKYFVGINTSSSVFTNWRYDNNKSSEMYNLQIECLNDTMRIKRLWKKTSSIIRFTSDLFKTKNIYTQDKYLASWQNIDRGYTSNKRLIKLFAQQGFLISRSQDKFELGYLLGAGIHIGKFRSVNCTVEFNHIWHTGGYNYFNAQLGLNFSLESLFN